MGCRSGIPGKYRSSGKMIRRSDFHPGDEFNFPMGYPVPRTAFLLECAVLKKYRMIREIDALWHM